MYIQIYVEFTHQQIHFFKFKKHIKIYIKIHINIAPTCFGLRSSSGSLLNLAKVILILEHSVKLRRYLLCGGVATCHGTACVLFVVHSDTESDNTHAVPW